MGIRRGDKVVVLSGNDKGKKGNVIEVVDDGAKVIVEGVNIVIKHKKARNAKQKSVREKKPGKIDVSNVQILCKCGKATRIAYKIDEKGRKHRVCAKCGEVLDKKFVKIKEKAKDAVEAEAKEEEDVAKKPLQRREVKASAESRISKSQVSGGSSATHRQIGGA